MGFAVQLTGKIHKNEYAASDILTDAKDKTTRYGLQKIIWKKTKKVLDKREGACYYIEALAERAAKSPGRSAVVP